MKLKQFQIKNYRSIKDSGPIEVAEFPTVLVGRNESGKSNVLRALHLLNPSDGAKINKGKDFPRDRRLDECTDDTPIVTACWELDRESDRQELHDICPLIDCDKPVQISLTYDGNRHASFELTAEFGQRLEEVAQSTRTTVAAASEASKEDIQTALSQLTNLGQNTYSSDDCQKINSALASLKQVLNGLDVSMIGDPALAELADAMIEDITEIQPACDRLIEKMPKFIYLDEYPQIPGTINIDTYLQHKTSNQLNDDDRRFEKMCKVAGLNPKLLQKALKEAEMEARNQHANRSSAVITKELRKLWTDRKIKVRLAPDAHQVTTYVSDPNVDYDVDVNLDERSRGFKWFLSFYVTFAADTQGGKAQGAILLLDEPGLYLHATAQGDLLTHLANDFRDNQIIYTTHSPFMIPARRPETLRTVNVNIDGQAGTTVSDTPKGDTKTLFPLQAALGYNVAQSLFIGPKDLIVEGIGDYWLLSFVWDDLGISRDFAITPAGSAQKIATLASLLASEKLDVVILFDNENSTQREHKRILREFPTLVAERQMIFVSEAFDDGRGEADIEDLLDPEYYEKLVYESYNLLPEKITQIKALLLEKKQHPRIVKRFEHAMGDSFKKTKPLRLLLDKPPKEVVTEEVGKRFRRLADVVQKAFDDLEKAKTPDPKS